MPGFQYTPGGIRPIGDSTGIDVSAQHGAAVVLTASSSDEDWSKQEAADVARVEPAPAPKAKAPAKTAAAAHVPGVTPRTVLKAARARTKEIRAELRRMKALQKELGQLERMLAAAAKPSASLTRIDARRAG